MRKCEFCGYSKSDYTSGSYQCFCTEKNKWVKWQRQAIFCSTFVDIFIHRYFEAEREMWEREIHKGIERAIEEKKGGGGDD